MEARLREQLSDAERRLKEARREQAKAGAMHWGRDPWGWGQHSDCPLLSTLCGRCQGGGRDTSHTASQGLCALHAPQQLPHQMPGSWPVTRDGCPRSPCHACTHMSVYMFPESLGLQTDCTVSPANKKL